MPVGMLRFKLPEEDVEFQTACMAGAYRAALDDIRNDIFRKRLKYTELTEEQRKLVSEMQDEFYRILSHWDVTEI